LKGIGIEKRTKVHMFTGIIEGLGTLAAIKSGGSTSRLVIAAQFNLDGTRIGDSIAVSGACLTVTHLQGTRFTADISPETVARTTFGSATVGQRVNLERALRLSDRLDGHLVSGHVDGIGVLENRVNQGNALILTFSASETLTHQMITKGSVAVDGVSLTINQCHATGFEVSIIPHTATMTTLGTKEIGATVNIETDLIGKYVEKFLQAQKNQPADSGSSPGVDMALLARSGFLPG
jgi:riboflavin synthase